MSALVPLVAALLAVGITQFFAWKLNELNKRIERDRKQQENYAKWMGHFFSFITIKSERFHIQHIEIPDLEALIEQNGAQGYHDLAKRNLEVVDELKKECNEKGKDLYDANCKLHEAEALIYFNEESEEWRKRFKTVIELKVSMNLDMGDYRNSALAKHEELKRMRASKIEECKAFARDYCAYLAESHRSFSHDKRLAIWVGAASVVCLLVGVAVGNMSSKSEVVKVQIVTSNGNPY